MVSQAEGLRAPFPRYWLSSFLSDFGDGVRLAAFPLLAVHYTRSPTAVAAITAVQGLPWLVLGAGAGVIVDRTDRRRVMMSMNIVQAVMMAALVAAILAHGAGLWLIYLAAFVTGIAAGLRGTAASASVPRLVKPADLDQANGRLIAGRIVGNELADPAAGGLLFGLAAVLPFAVNAGTLGVAVLLLLTLPGVLQPEPRDPGQAPASRAASVRRDLAEGIRWLLHHRDVRDLTIAVGVISAMDAAWFAVFVLYVVQVLQLRPGAYGVLLAIGALGGTAAQLPRPMRRKPHRPGRSVTSRRPALGRRSWRLVELCVTSDWRAAGRHSYDDQAGFFPRCAAEPHAAARADCR
jgi:MFS family permease